MSFNYRSRSLQLSMFQGQALFRLLTIAFLTACAAFVGGPVMAGFVLSSLLFAIVATRYFGTAFGVCVGLISTLVVTLVELFFFVPIIRGLGLTRSWFFDEATIKPFVARDTTLEHLIELNRVGSILIAFVPVVLALLIARNLRAPQQPKEVNPLLVVVAFLPLLISTVKKFTDPISYIVTTTSGDGRNFFLHVQRIRVTSGFTSLSMFSSQGDLSASLSSLVSDGLGSTGLFQFNDQYSIAAIYTFFGILISASAIATVVALTEKKGDLLPHQFSVLHLAVFVLVGSFSITMPWVMNEMFRSGFSSAVAAMSLCAAMVAVIVSRSSFMVKAILLIAISVLSFAVYQVAAIYPLFALAVLAVPPLVKKLRSHPVQITLVILFVVGLAIRALPQVKDRMRSRLLLEGSITYLTDSPWIPLGLAGLALSLVRGRIRTVGFILFVTGACTAGFQTVARYLREGDGQVGYGYYGAKFAYIGLFILILTIIASMGALLCAAISQSKFWTTERSIFDRSRELAAAIGIFVLATSAGTFVIPESRGFFGKSDNWVAPTGYGLQLAVSYWDEPQVVFAQVADPGSDRLINFWHPYFWSGDPWNWSYANNFADYDGICTFIQDKDIIVVTGDANYAEALRDTCKARVEIS
jgi:hypothetical protein